MEGRLPLVGLNIVPAESFRAAAGPLFEEGIVDALEFDVDDTFGFDDGAPPLPGWMEQVLDLYGEGDALYGHAVYMSFLTARWEERQARWLERMAAECRRRKYRHVSEHFGFISAGDILRGPMLPLPFSPAAVRVGQDRLRRLAEATGARVGLELGASVLCAADATEQGPFLDAVLAPSDGFLILDVHNIWVQCHNLGIDAATVMDTYPLDRVRELHISGGSWWQPRTDPDKGPLRMDSHDGALPDEALALLQSVLPRCRNLEVVIMENRGAGYETADGQRRYQDDFRRVRQLVEAAHG